MHKKIALFGSTGSIGVQSLEVIRQFPELFQVEVLTAFSNLELFRNQILEFNPTHVVIPDENKAGTLRTMLGDHPVQIHFGQDALKDQAAQANYDILIAAIVGFAGLASTWEAVQRGKIIALANKETLVVAGDLVRTKVLESGARLIPVDSEHSALFQCLIGEDPSRVEKITLTASGGPFLGKKPNFLINVKKDHALQHPNWTMGAKITIDSASLMNKGLEMIEAKWLFGMSNEQIEVIIHPQSIVHSFVHFTDGSVKAQLGLPDMKLPIQYALGYPERLSNNHKRYEIKNYPSLTFEVADTKTFRNLALAKEAMYRGGNSPCVLNAANEVVVEAFLKNRIGFLEMSDIIEQCLERMTFIEHPTMDDYIHSDLETRKLASTLYK